MASEALENGIGKIGRANSRARRLQTAPRETEVKDNVRDIIDRIKSSSAFERQVPLQTTIITEQQTLGLPRAELDMESATISLAVGEGAYPKTLQVTPDILPNGDLTGLGQVTELSQLESANNLTSLRKRLTRRLAVPGMIVVAGAAGILGLNAARDKSVEAIAPVQSITSPLLEAKDTVSAPPLVTTESLPDEKNLTVQKYKLENKGFIRVFYNKEKLPVMYELSNGKKIPLDLEKVKEAAQTAREMNSTVLLDVGVMERYNTGNPKELEEALIEDKDHPVFKELPSNVMTAQELAERGIRVVQGKDVNLYITSDAFDWDAPLEAFNPVPQEPTNPMGDQNKDLKELHKPKSLTIVEADTFALFRQLLDHPEDPSAKMVPEFPEESIQKYVDFEKERLANKISDLQKKSTGVEETEQEILRKRTMLAAFEGDKVPLKQLIAGALDSSGRVPLSGDVQKWSSYLGVYLTDATTSKPWEGNNWVFFITRKTFSNDFTGIFMGPDGKIQIANQEVNFGGLFGKLPENFYRGNLTSEEYARAGTYSLPAIFEHEMNHLYLSTRGLLAFDEREVNMHAFWNNRVASSRLEMDPRDQSGRPFLLSVPKEYGGGYVRG
ncbi:hypothetical protein M1349_00985 [Patescibacteria group bacterium]|nr:hypothetical protein [Patescibacteria group bacterium]